MTGVEVLAPVRLETRFVAPEDRTDGVAEWMLRLRVHPDEFSTRHEPPPPTGDELDRLAEALAAMSGAGGLSESDAFASFASAVGAVRALRLWRDHVVSGVDGPAVDRSGEVEGGAFTFDTTVELPERLEVWFVHADGTTELKHVLTPDLVRINQDLDLLPLFRDLPSLRMGQLPEAWWLSYKRARDLGLGVDLDVGVEPPRLDALVVLGRGETDAAGLVDAHNASGRMAVLAQGTPTNTVAGGETAVPDTDPAPVHSLLHVQVPSSQPSTAAVLSALTGRVPPDAFPVLGGELDHRSPGADAVRGLWPVLWGRALRDVIGSDREPELCRWAGEHLAVEGPLPAIRVGEQPYGLLPVSSFAAWLGDPGDPLAELEELIRSWGTAWRAGAAELARAAGHRVHGADTARLLEVLGLHAPNRHWRVRPVADLHLIQAERALSGMPPMPATDWDRMTADTWRHLPYPAHPIGPAARSGRVPGPPGDAEEDAGALHAMIEEHGESLYTTPRDLGLVGHLFRESLICVHAVVVEALEQFSETGVVDPNHALPLDDVARYRQYAMSGHRSRIDELTGQTDAGGTALGERFREVLDMLRATADRWKENPERVLRAVLAALDTAAFRVDPWLTGLASRRLRLLIDEGAPFRLGAYGWVDSPAPHGSTHDASLPPGPTEAGLLHAPSHQQALTAALLRDAAVRNPGDGRWDLRIDSADVRAAAALAERVRLGVHPYEALGLEVEKIAGDWDTVQLLRENYGEGTRRVCDGAAVLRDALAGAIKGSPPADLATRLEGLQRVLDTYADLLIADAAHALASGRPDLANAAMEAAAGFGAPSELRAMRTPRSAKTVRVAAWVLLEPGSAGTDPMEIADPAYTALAGPNGDPRLSAVLGGDSAPAPSLTGGRHEAPSGGLLPETADADLLAAVIADLSERLGTLRDRAKADEIAAVGLGTAAEIGAFAARWAVDLSAVTSPDGEAAEPADLREALIGALADRHAAPTPPTTVDEQTVQALRSAIRELAGRPELPVLPIVDRALVPKPHPDPGLDSSWLEIAAAVRPRLAPLEALRLAPDAPEWTSAIAAPNPAKGPWQPKGPVLITYGPAVTGTGKVAIAALDAWSESIPSRHHTTSAAFGFNSPKARPPQAVLLAVPPDLSQRLDNVGLLDVVLETRELAHARAARPADRAGLPHATPSALVHTDGRAGFLRGWRQ